MSVVLGINSSFTSNHHDPSASLFVDGKLVAACEEERFTRTKTSLVGSHIDLFLMFLIFQVYLLKTLI